LTEDRHRRRQYVHGWNERVSAVITRAPLDSPDTTVVPGAANAAEAVRRLIRARPNENLVVTPAPSWLTPAMCTDAERAIDIKAMRDGCRMDWITAATSQQPGVIRQHMDILHRAGEQISLAPSVRQLFYLFDRQVAVIPMAVEDSSRGALVVRSPAIVGQLTSLFLELKDRAKAYESLDPVPQLRTQVLQLLADGLKDESIARRLAVSPRTVRRCVSVLMAECGADSRFQLALAAVRLGWLTNDDLVGTVPPAG
jgi:DNA-binding NarL/FixJ family response regulator